MHNLLQHRRLTGWQMSNEKLILVILPCKSHLCRIISRLHQSLARAADILTVVTVAIFENWTADLCAARHWQACSQPETLWTGAGGTLPDIPPQWSECWEPWPGDWGPGSYSGKLPASTAPRSPEPAPTTTDRACMKHRRDRQRETQFERQFCISCIQM